MFNYVISEPRDAIEIWGTFSDYHYLHMTINSVIATPFLGLEDNEFLSEFSQLIQASLSTQKNTHVSYGAPPSLMLNPFDKSGFHQYHEHRVTLDPIHLVLSMAYLRKVLKTDFLDYSDIGYICLLNHVSTNAFNELAFCSLHPLDWGDELIAKHSYETLRKRYFDALKQFEKMSEPKRYENFESVLNKLHG